MTLPLADLQRLLPDAVGVPLREEDGVFHPGDAGWELRVTRLEPRPLGRLALERLSLDWAFRDLDQVEREALIARFRLHFHKGGG